MLKAFFILSLLPLLLYSNQLRVSDSLALVDIYNNHNGPNWANSWDLNEPIDTYSGIDIENNRVVGVTVSGYNLTGGFPESVLQLSELRTLAFPSWDSVVVPDSIIKLQHLKELHLTDVKSMTPLITNFTDMTSFSCTNCDYDEIPEYIHSFKKLNFLNLNTNYLTEIDLDSNLFPNLTLFVEGNRLSLNEIEKYYGKFAKFNYFRQCGECDDRRRLIVDTLTMNVGDEITIHAKADGSQSRYQWKKNNSIIAGEESNLLTIDSPGQYRYTITSDSLPNVTFFSRIYDVSIETSVAIEKPTATSDSYYLYTYTIQGELLGIEHIEGHKGQRHYPPTHRDLNNVVTVKRSSLTPPVSFVPIRSSER